MATQPRQGFVRAPGHVEEVFGAALTRKPKRRRAQTVRAQPVRALPPVPRLQSTPRPRSRWWRWRRLALYALGVPFALQNVFLDPKRWSVTVTSHAVEQAGERFREGNPAVIAAEVADAIASQRVARCSPYRSRPAWGTARHAWIEEGHKTYVIRRSHRTWIVITALPPEGANT